ncbi:MAG: hypothetical protein H7239_04355 [Flavobacterium sp.]|nr:hypothetical protein [Flavobacterium sp.]
MELINIESLIEKYFQGETTSSEETELRTYFESSNVATHLKHYKPVFMYFKQAKKEQFTAPIVLKPKKRKYVAWLSAVASVAILLGVGTFIYLDNKKVVHPSEFGTYDNPEIAMKETQKALALLSGHINTGIESVEILSEYKYSKNKIFKE